jgi:hypothetical protein
MQLVIQVALISAVITSIGFMIGFVQWRRDLQVKLGQIRETPLGGGLRVSTLPRVDPAEIARPAIALSLRARSTLTPV